jgi:hypothetical protein
MAATKMSRAKTQRRKEIFLFFELAEGTLNVAEFPKHEIRNKSSNSNDKNSKQKLL